VGLAARGQRETGTGLQLLDDAWLAGQLRRQARELLVEAGLVAAFLTGVALLLPG
jgi:hypothetical protein